MFPLEQKGPYTLQPVIKSVHNWELTQTGNVICIHKFSKWQYDISVAVLMGVLQLTKIQAWKSGITVFLSFQCHILMHNTMN